MGSIFRVQPQSSLDRLVCNDQSWRQSMLVVSTWANVREGWQAGRLVECIGREAEMERR